MYQKEIIYMGLYKDGSRMGSAGFMKLENRDRECRFCLRIQNVPLGISGRFPVRIYSDSGWKEINGITIQDGRGSWEDSVAEETDRTVIQVMLSDGYMLEGKSKSAPSVPDTRMRPEAVQPNAAADVPETVQMPQTTVEESVREPVIVTEELPRRSWENTDTIPQSVPDHDLKEDKWEQILSSYENIHPYGDERVYVKLEPKDFVILQSKYQHLVNNSFLLHGFYNYRYVILGKEQDYYLGVPGVFYEREKMVAQMFGFEAFECPGGNVRGGEFGYYLRKVEL